MIFSHFTGESIRALLTKARASESEPFNSNALPRLKNALASFGFILIASLRSEIALSYSRFLRKICMAEHSFGVAGLLKDPMPVLNLPSHQHHPAAAKQPDGTLTAALINVGRDIAPPM